MGVFLSRSSPLTMGNCTLSENTALYSGGGIFARDGNTLVITNCTISHNVVQNEDDIELCGERICSQPYEKGALFLENCTFYANEVKKLGRSLCHHDNYRGAGFVANSIFWGNAQTTRGEIFAPTPLTITCSVTDLQGEGNTSEDPWLRVLKDNRSPTETCAPDGEQITK